MLTHAIKKVLDTMIATKPSSSAEHEVVDANLIMIQEEYLENAPGINWMEMRVINKMDTQCVDPIHILL